MRRRYREAEGEASYRRSEARIIGGSEERKATEEPKIGRTENGSIEPSCIGSSCHQETMSRWHVRTMARLLVQIDIAGTGVKFDQRAAAVDFAAHAVFVHGAAVQSDFAVDAEFAGAGLRSEIEARGLRQLNSHVAGTGLH